MIVIIISLSTILYVYSSRMHVRTQLSGCGHDRKPCTIVSMRQKYMAENVPTAAWPGCIAYFLIIYLDHLKISPDKTGLEMGVSCQCHQEVLLQN